MKKLTTPLFATLFVFSSRLIAAEPESAFGLAPSPAPPLAPTAPSSPSPGLPLIPDALQPAEKPDAKPTKPDDLPHGDKTTMAEDRLKKTILLRQAKIKAEREPDLQAIMAKALAARTDYEARLLYIDYYSGLVDRMAKFEPSLKKEDLALLKRQYTGRFYQTRIAPTIDPAVARAKPN